MINFTFLSFADSKYGLENPKLDISNILKEQGVRIDDLMALRESLMKGELFVSQHDATEKFFSTYSSPQNAADNLLSYLEAFVYQQIVNNSFNHCLGGFKFNDEEEGDFEDG